MAWYSIGRGLLSVCEDLVLLASGAAFDVIHNPFFHSRPPVFLLHFPKSFVPARVPCCWMIVHEGHDASFNFKDRRHNDLSFWIHSGGCHYEFFFWEYYDIFIVSFSFVSTWRSREHVRGCVCFTQYIKDFIVVFLEVGMPPGCSSIEVLRGLPVLQVCMVSHDGEGEFGPS